MLHADYHPGDWVIYRKTKFSTHPGPRAQNVSPARCGEKYAYTVDKFWVVVQVLSGGELLVQTRRGKAHRVSAGDPDLHRARWWERLLFRQRFAAITQGERQTPTPTPSPSHRRAG